MTDSATPRCADCHHVLPSTGAVCHVCDVETHFEGVLRTAPPMFSRRDALDAAATQQQPADLRVS